MILDHKVALGQVLFAGGAGFVGRTAVRWFRQRHPSVRVLVGGRNLQAAGGVAQEVGAAEAVAIDPDKPRLGLGDDVAVAAVVMLAPEAGLKGLSYAQDLGVPYLNINSALTEIGPELAMFAHRATAATRSACQSLDGWCGHVAGTQQCQRLRERPLHQTRRNR